MPGAGTGPIPPEASSPVGRGPTPADTPHPSPPPASGHEAPPLPDTHGLAGLLVEPRDGGGYVVTYPRSLLAGLIRGPLPGWAIVLGLGISAVVMLQRMGQAGEDGSGSTAENWLLVVSLFLLPALIFAISTTVVWCRKRLTPATLEVWDGGARLTQPCVLEDWVLDISPGDLIQARSRGMPPWSQDERRRFNRLPLTRFGPMLELTMSSGARNCVLESQSTQVIDWTKRLLTSMSRDWETRTVAAIERAPERAGIEIDPSPASPASPDSPAGAHKGMRVTAQSDGRLVRYTRVGMLPTLGCVLSCAGVMLAGFGWFIVHNEDDQYSFLGTIGDLVLVSVVIVLGTLGVLAWTAWRRSHPPEMLIGRNRVELRLPAVFWMQRVRFGRGDLSSVAVGMLRDESQPVLELVPRRGRTRHVLRGQERAALLWTQSQIHAATGARITTLRTRKRSAIDFNISPALGILIVVCFVVVVIALALFANRA